MLDRIDMIISVSRVPNDLLFKQKLATNTQHLAAKKLIKNARAFQLNRYESSNKNNSGISSNEIMKPHTYRANASKNRN